MTCCNQLYGAIETEAGALHMVAPSIAGDTVKPVKLHEGLKGLLDELCVITYPTG